MTSPWSASASPPATVSTTSLDLWKLVCCLVCLPQPGEDCAWDEVVLGLFGWQWNRRRRVLDEVVLGLFGYPWNRRRLVSWMRLFWGCLGDREIREDLCLGWGCSGAVWLTVESEKTRVWDEVVLGLFGWQWNWGRLVSGMTLFWGCLGDNGIGEDLCLGWDGSGAVWVKSEMKLLRKCTFSKMKVCTGLRERMHFFS